MTDAHPLDPLLDGAPCGFLTFADDGSIRAVNRTLLDLLGYAREELAGRRVEAVLGVGGRIFYQTHLFPLLRLHGRAEEIFLPLRARDGRDVGTLVNARRRERGGEWLSDCVLMEVRERRKFEEALLRANKELEDANALLERQAVELEMSQQQLVDQAEELERQRTLAQGASRTKSQFLAVMSHELRTPLNAIGGYTQLLEMGVHGPVSDAQRDVLARILRSQRHLLRLISDVLDLSRIEAGRVSYHVEPLVLRRVVDAVLPFVEPQLAAKRLRCVVSVPDELTGWGDREKVEQILLNLLSNAVKFTPEQGSVRVEAVPGADPAPVVHLSVHDTGIGIPPEKLAQVFEPFVQVDTSGTRAPEGTGLGLTISRDLARGMGGDLDARSDEGAGSRFTLTLPTAPPEPQGSTATEDMR